MTTPATQPATHLLYIALSLRTPPLAAPSPLHWALLITPATSPPSTTGTLHTYTILRTTALRGPVWVYNAVPIRTHSTAVEKQQDATTELIARLLIAEVVNVEALEAKIAAWSEREVEGETREGRWRDVCKEWVVRVLGRLEGVEGEVDGGDGGEGGGGGGEGGDGNGNGKGKGKGKSSASEKFKCLGRRMGTFESVEAEGRQFAGAVQAAWEGEGVGRGREEGAEVPTRVLFDRRSGVGMSGGASSSVGGKGKGEAAVVSEGS